VEALRAGHDIRAFIRQSGGCRESTDEAYVPVSVDRTALRGHTQHVIARLDADHERCAVRPREGREPGPRAEVNDDPPSRCGWQRVAQNPVQQDARRCRAVPVIRFGEAAPAVDVGLNPWFHDSCVEVDRKRPPE
jgi:hypothetical protein